MMNDERYADRLCARYLGQHKPIAPYPLTNGLLILPAGSGMFPYGPGGEIRLNISFLVGSKEMSNSDLIIKYREWLVFDSFVLNDHFPIFYFDESKTGILEIVPTGELHEEATPDYKQIDYGNIADVVLMTAPEKKELPKISYSDLFAIYCGLPSEIREMLEWFVSEPYLPFTRDKAFSNTNYWQLVHKTILLERLIGMPPKCSGSFGPCTVCGLSLPPHNSVPRRKWLRQYLATRIDNDGIAEEYASVIEAGVDVRNKIAHVPMFDRSSMPELVPGEPQTYGVDRAIGEYEHDSVALNSLLNSLRDIARFLLLDKAFRIKYFPSLRPLKVVRVEGPRSPHER